MLSGVMRINSKSVVHKTQLLLLLGGFFEVFFFEQKQLIKDALDKYYYIFSFHGCHSFSKHSTAKRKFISFFLFYFAVFFFLAKFFIYLFWCFGIHTLNMLYSFMSLMPRSYVRT